MSADVEQWPPPNDPTAFESLCLDLWKNLWQDPGAQKNGRSGQPQAGVDVFGRHQGRQVGVQCKQKDGLLRTKLGVTELEEEVAAARHFQPPLAGFILATTGARDAKLQQRARELTEHHKLQGLFTVEVWSWEDIWSELYQREQLLKRIAPNYWPRLSAMRWGENAVIAPSRLFRGKNTGFELLIGREQELAALDAAWSGVGDWRLAIGDPNRLNKVHPSHPHIITILAWGGIGKTSLVAHWAAKKLAQPEHAGIDRYFDWSFYSEGTRREGDTTGAYHTASADLLLKEALQFFGDPHLATSNADAWQKGARLAQLIGQHRSLLILDGLEPLQDPRTAELGDNGLCALLRGLAADNRGLCLVTARQRLPDLATWHQTTTLEWQLLRLTDESGAALLTKLGVIGTDPEKRDLTARVKGHALTLTLLGRYLKRAHHGDIRCVDRVDFQKMNEKEQGGHAFRVIAAYERWFEENDCRAELAILRMLGLFDRPATPDCLVALRDPPVPGLTDTIATLNEDDWNEAVTHLVELNLVEEQPWEPRRILGYSKEQVDATKIFSEMGFQDKLGELRSLEIQQPTLGNRHALDAHPLIREFFSKRLQDTSHTAWQAAHSRLFEHLRTSAPYWPEGLEGLQPLYQAVAHGCKAGLQEKVLWEVYDARILRGTTFYSLHKLGAFTSDLAVLACFFDVPWVRTALPLSQNARASLFASVSYQLRALGRLPEAVPPMTAGLEARMELRAWKNAAISASNLSELELALGALSEALRYAEQAVGFAEQAAEAYQLMVARTALADVLNQAGREADALRCFREAENLYTKGRPAYPLIWSVQGFQYCDLLLTAPERAAWQLWLDPKSRARNPQLMQACGTVEQRAVKTLKWAGAYTATPVVDIGLNHLTLGRVALYRAILESSRASPLDGKIALAQTHLATAVEVLRRAGQHWLMPLGLLTNAWLRVVQGQPDLAKADLDQAQQIAERGPMRLHLADIHLHRTRLFRDREELKRARVLIEQCGYWRRKQELEDAEKGAENWGS